MMKNWFGAVFLVFWSLNIYSQTKYFEYKTTKFEEFSFPIFKHEDSATVTKINQLLQLSELEMLDGYQRKNIFENLNNYHGTIYGDKVEMRFKVFSNTAKVLSIQIDQASCGLTCHYWVNYYNFNSQNGDLMQLQDFFTPDGFVNVKKMILKKRTQQFKYQLTKLKSGSEDLLYVIDYFKNDNLVDFYIKDSSIYIDGRNCLNKNDKFYGVNMVAKIKFSDFKNDLNDCGKAFFSGTIDSVSNYYSNSLPQLFDGVIGDSLQIMMLVQEGGCDSFVGLYAYTKYGRGIVLRGNLVKNKLTFIEKDKELNDNGYIDAIFDGKTLEGTWKNKSKTKTYSISARRRN